MHLAGDAVPVLRAVGDRFEDLRNDGVLRVRTHRGCLVAS
jgi:hypothetical protein